MKKWKGVFVSWTFCLIIFWTSAANSHDIVIGFSGPLSGPAAEYGQDCFNGLDLAVKEMNAGGGITVKGERHLFRLVRLDDRSDPASAVSNARRLQSQKAVAIWNPVFSTIGAMAKINEEKGNEFILMAYTSTPKLTRLGNKLLVGVTAPPFTVYLQVFAELARKEGWKRVAMVVTLGAYGEEWRKAFADYWQKSGGMITADKPVNYYTETDFSTALTAALATRPDALLIGGPSSTTALVIDQARGMGFTGGFIIIDQAKLDYMANLLKGYKLMNNTIGVATPMSIPVPASAGFEKRYKAAYKTMITSEAFRHYGSMIALSKAIEKADTTTDVHAILAALPKALPITGDRIPTEIFGINNDGRLHIHGSIQTVKNNQLTPPVQYFWWIKNDRDWIDIKKVTKSTANMVRFESKMGDVQ